MHAATGDISTQAVIHIGYGKTGTTSIQWTLENNRDRLWSHKVLYPRAGVINGAQHGLCPLDGSSAEEEYVKLRHEIESLAPRLVLLSSENFSFAPLGVIDNLAGLFAGSARILFYVRHQVDLVESVFLEWQKVGLDYRGNIRRFFAAHKQSFNFMLRIQPWIDRFGGANILARVFDKRVIGEDVVSDFLRSAGLPANLQPAGVLNTSLIPEFSSLMSLLDEGGLDSAFRRPVVNELLRISRTLRSASQLRLVDSKMATEIGEIFAESNSAFAESFLPPEQRHLLTGDQDFH